MPICRTLLFLLAFSCVLPSPAVAQSCQKTVGWFEESPYSMLGADGKPHGINIDLITEVLSRVGCNVEFVQLPVPRGLLYLQTGTIDMFAGLYQNGERSKYAYFSTALTRARSFVYFSDKAPSFANFKKLNDLVDANLLLGIVNQHSYGAEFDEVAKVPVFAKKLRSVDNLNSIWQMMSIGRLDATISDAVTARNDLNRLGLSNVIHKSAIVVTDEPDHVAFSKKIIDKEFVDRFDLAFNSMLRDGSFTKIWQRYIACDVSLKFLGCE